MRIYKTSMKNRETYRYHFANGDSQEIVVNDEVTAEDIAFLHSLDDKWVDQERRASYLAPISYDDFVCDEDNTFESNPFLVDERNGLNIILQDETQGERAQLFEALHEAMKKLTVKQKRTIEKIFYQGLSLIELAREDKVDKSAITYRLRGIYKKLRKEINYYFENK